MTSLKHPNDVSDQGIAVPGGVRRWRAFALLALSGQWIAVLMSIDRQVPAGWAADGFSGPRSPDRGSLHLSCWCRRCLGRVFGAAASRVTPLASHPHQDLGVFGLPGAFWAL